MLGRRTGFGKMLEKRENFKEVNFKFLETRRDDQDVREQMRMEGTKQQGLSLLVVSHGALMMVCLHCASENHLGILTQLLSFILVYWLVNLSKRSICELT